MTIRKYFLSRLRQRRHAMAVPLCLPLRDCRLCEAWDKGRCACPWSWTWECVTVGLLGHGAHVACRCVHARKDTLQEWSRTELEGNRLVLRVLERCQLQRNCPSWVSSVTPSAVLPVRKGVFLKDEWRWLVMRLKLFPTSLLRNGTRDAAIRIGSEWLYIITDKPLCLTEIEMLSLQR